MPITSANDIYRFARDGGYGVSGFCAENMEMVQAILRRVRGPERYHRAAGRWLVDLESVIARVEHFVALEDKGEPSRGYTQLDVFNRYWRL